MPIQSAVLPALNRGQVYAFVPSACWGGFPTSISQDGSIPHRGYLSSGLFFSHRTPRCRSELAWYPQQLLHYLTVCVLHYKERESRLQEHLLHAPSPSSESRYEESLCATVSLSRMGWCPNPQLAPPPPLTQRQASSHCPVSFLLFHISVRTFPPWHWSSALI